MPDAKPQDLTVGDVLNHTYRLDQQIGEGGMGRVFQATDLKLERKVAVKALHAANADVETIRRFDRETQVMGQLDHPGVVTLFAFGRTRGVPWLAMRLLEGRDLWELLAEAGGRMTPAQLLPIVRQTLTALGYLHGRGLLHRDLKPSNIHIGKTGRVTLCDFGLARGHKSSLTRTGVIWGTPEYMAPEQILGERELDGRTDLYSLAVVMFRVLAGQPLFPDATDQDVLRAHLSRPRPDVARVVPTLSPMIGAAMQKGLAIHPEDRFQSAEEMLAAFEMVLSLPPVGVKPVPSPAPSPVRRSGGTRVVPHHREASVETAPGVASPDTKPQEDSEPSTRPHGFPALDDDSSARTRRDGFEQLTVVGGVSTRPEGFEGLESRETTVTPVEENHTQPVRLEPEPAQTMLGSGGDTAPVNKKVAVPVPLMVGGAVLLFLLGLVVAKVLG
ncbi:MAG: serine/threonine protein kinase [Archangiaceae bacterium]|nr:serine/threonine protein kinase [Archangiaceae bacterium]